MLNSEEIKKFISHQDVHLGSFAVEYFNLIFSDDTEILNLALDRYPVLSDKEKIYLLLHTENLKLNLQSVNKLLSFLPNAPHILKYKFESHLVNCNVSLIKQAGLDKLKLSTSIKKLIDSKLKFSALSTEELIEELSNFSAENEDKYINEFDSRYGYLIVDELANREDLDDNLIIKTLTENEFDEFTYYECYLLTLAGKRKLSALIPVFIKGLGDDDLISEESMHALIRFGTKDIVEAIANAYLKEDDGFKIFATGVLENIKTEESENTALKLLKKEKDITIKTMLAGALCRLFSVKAIPEIKKLIEEGYDSSVFNLEEFVYINCIFNGLNIPEMALWKESYEKERGFYLEVSKTPVPSTSKVGRNDPCPCGSGKKYKKCCGSN